MKKMMFTVLVLFSISAKSQTKETKVVVDTSIIILTYLNSIKQNLTKIPVGDYRKLDLIEVFDILINEQQKKKKP